MNSFQYILDKILIIQSVVSPQTQILLAGNKNDLHQTWAVSIEEAEKIALKHGMFYIDYSCKLDDQSLLIGKLEEMVDKLLLIDKSIEIKQNPFSIDRIKIQS